MSAADLKLGFTPGAWSTRAAADGAGNIGILVADPGAPRGAVIVAEVFSELRYEGQRSEQTLWNAHLIAAAPDLLLAGIEACGALQGAAEIMRRLGNDRTADKLLELMQPLVAAINKATKPGAAQ